MHKSNDTFKHLRAIEDQSHLITETWTDLARNLFLTAVVAVSVWVFAGTLLWSVDHSSEMLLYKESFDTKTMMIILGVLLLGGIIRDFLLRSRAWSSEQGDGVSTALKQFYVAYQEQLKGTPHPNQLRYSKPTFMSAVRRVILTFLTIGTGGSGGLEGPVIPVGESVASGWSRLFALSSPDDLRLLQMAGISAAFSTLLSTPYMAAVFAAEVVFSDRLIYRPLFYSLIAAIIAHFCNTHFLHVSSLFSFHPHAHLYHLKDYFYAALVAILISAPAAIGLRLLFEKLKKIILLIPAPTHATVGALLTGSVALFVWFIWDIPPSHILGVGEKTLTSIYEGTGDPLLQNWWILLIIVLAKAVATGFTLMAGGSAGLLIPAMFMGGMSGAIVFHLLSISGTQINPEIFIVSGVASALVSVIEAPLAAMAFVLEGFGAVLAPPAIAACVICHLFAKRLRLYTNPAGE